MKSPIKFYIIGIVLAGLVGYTLYFLYQKSEEKPIEYKTEQAEIRDIIKKTVATGSVKPRKEIEIKPQISGIVQKLYVEPGNVIKKGDLIAKIQVIPDMISLNNAENRVNRAKISLSNEQKDFDRNKSLFSQGVISESEFQVFERNLANAKEELEAAENNIQLIKQGASKRLGKSSNTLVRSTIEGMVLDVPIEEGNSVIESNTFNDGTTIASVADMGKLIFEGNVDESEVGKIKPGMDLILKIGAIEDETFDATLEYISPKGVEDNGAIQFEIRAALIPREGQFIRAGYSANADIVLARKDSVLAIEESLVQFANDSTFVEVENGNQEFDRKLVTIGLSDGIYTEVIDGLTAEDKIKQPNTELRE